MTGVGTRRLYAGVSLYEADPGKRGEGVWAAMAPPAGSMTWRRTTGQTLTVHVASRIPERVAGKLT